MRRPVGRSEEASRRGRRLSKWAERGIAAGIPCALVWSLLDPLDSVSVFEGSALPQNLAWLALAFLAGTCLIRPGGGDAAAAAPRQAWYRRAVQGGWPIVAVWIAVGAALAGLENNPRTAWHGVWHVVGLAGWFFAVGRACHAMPGLRSTFLVTLVAGCVGLSAYGIHQAWVVLPRLRAQYERDAEAMLAEVQQFAPEGSPQRARFRDRLYSPEPYATFALANSLAVTLSLGLVLMAGGAAKLWCGRPGLSSFRAPRGAVLVGLALIFGCWLLTRSRGAWLATSLAAGAGGTWRWAGRRPTGSVDGRSWRLVGSVVGVLLVLAGGLAIVVRQDALVLSEAPKSLAFRLEYWQATARMILDHPWMGVGLGNFQNYYPYYKLATASEEIADPHHWVLDWAASFSVPVAVWAVGWVAFCVCRMRGRVDPHRGNGPERTVDAGGDAGEDGPRKRPGWEDGGPERWALGGALVGGLICLAGIGLLQGIDLEAQTLAWAVALLVAWLIWPVRQVFVDATTGAIAAVAVVLSLMVAGSWQAPGIAGPWLLVVASLVRPGREEQIPAGGERPEERDSGRIGAVVRRPSMVGAAWGGLLAAFLLHAWIPVTRCWNYLERARLAATPQERDAWLERAGRADPMEAAVAAARAQAAVADALATPAGGFEVRARQAVEALDAWTTWEEASFATWRSAGDRTLELAAGAAARGGSPRRWIDAALAYYRRSVARYPTNVQLWAQVAVVAAHAGQTDLSRAAQRQARRLSRVTPHLDRKLEAQMVWWPLPVDPAVSLPPSNRGFYPAEPMLDALRRISDR